AYTVGADDVSATGVTIGNTLDLNGGSIQDSYPLWAALALPAADGSGIRFESAAGSPSTAPVVQAPDYVIAQPGRPFSFQIVASQAPTTYSLSISPAPATPLGLTLDAATGLISGTPQISGNYTLTVSATNASGTATRTVSLEIPHGIVSVVGPTAGVYRAGDQVVFQVVFSTNVQITGSPTLPIILDSSAVQASYAFGSGKTHGFVYTLQPADLDRDEVITLSSALSLNIARVADAATGAYVRTRIPAESQTIRSVVITDAPAGSPPVMLEGTWNFGDIGNTGLAGSNSSDGASITVNAAGADIWDGADSFRFVYRSLTGDGVVEAQVASLTHTNAWTKAGVMIRESLAADARNVFVFATPASGIAAQARLATGGSTELIGGALAPAPYWVRLVRTGPRVVAYSSPDASAWTEIAAFDVTLGATAYFGFAVTSHDASQLATAVFSEPFV
ncbi:MAG: putative Ig domain-containing protein, partial [Verrucomicrobiota bacterium]